MNSPILVKLSEVGASTYHYEVQTQNLAGHWCTVLATDDKGSALRFAKVALNTGRYPQVRIVDMQA